MRRLIRTEYPLCAAALGRSAALEEVACAMTKGDSDELISYTFIRLNHKAFDKFDMKELLLGKLYAEQSVRALGRYHSNFSNFRTELDHTRYARWLFPTKHWNEPVMYNTGFGVDDHSGTIKGFVHTMSTAARDVIRLYRRCVLPKSMWLPSEQLHLAADWDVFGLETMLAMDHGSGFIAKAASEMFLSTGAILLRVPVRRGDLKGSVERTQETAEQQHVSTKSGYVPQQFAGLDPRYKVQRERARLAADATVATAEAEMAAWTNEFNAQAHPQLGAPRIRVYRSGLEMAPIILPTGLLQLRTTFALTYSPLLLREGVEVEGLKYNSSELHIAFRTYSGTVTVKLDPDDARTVLVFVPKLAEPIEAQLTTLNISFPITLELLKLLMQRVLPEPDNPSDAWIRDPTHTLLSELERLQGKPHEPTPGRTKHTDAQAATHAAAAPPASPQPPAHDSQRLPSLSELLYGSTSKNG